MFTVKSPAFAERERIPLEFASPKVGGQGHSIPLAWSGAPADTASFAVVVVDQAQVAHDFVHWDVSDLPPDVSELAAAASGTGRMPAGAREYPNSGGSRGYAGPNPPAGSGDHPYEITVYALNVPHVDLPSRPSAADIERALQGKVLARARLTGIYSK